MPGGSLASQTEETHMGGFGATQAIHLKVKNFKGFMTLACTFCPRLFSRPFGRNRSFCWLRIPNNSEHTKAGRGTWCVSGLEKLSSPKRKLWGEISRRRPRGYPGRRPSPNVSPHCSEPGGQQQQLKTTSDVTSKFLWCCRASVL